jgi:hypothetical protein
LENIRVLLNYGVRKGLECIYSGRWLRATDFARPIKANIKERYGRSGHEVQVYKENIYQRDLDRRAIVRLLEERGGAK